MYEQISANIWRSRILIVLFIAFFILFGYVLSYYDPILMPLAIIVAVLMTVGSFYHSDKIVLASMKARVADKAEFPHFVNSVESMALAAGLPTPKAYVIDDPSPNAFATGRDPEHALICATTGLIAMMNRQELEGVVAHEMSHIKNYDIRFMMLVAVLVGAIALMADWFWWSARLGGGRRRSSREGDQLQAILMVVALVFMILAPISAAMVQAAISRKREYLADASGAMLTRFPEGLASALQKIGSSAMPMESANKATAHLFIANPFQAGKLANWFSTHPPIEDRVQKLRAM
ncbi:MAG: M48 family metalloprotease [Armatimonadetes bacterium]|jgi:heat shock protein HtpX|nr:M48 family metalloprotease [Armatimonadota bacterium]